MESTDDNQQLTFEIALTGGKKTVVDAADFEVLSAHKWFASTNGYAVRTVRINGKRNYRVHMHRIILGVDDPALRVDHID